MSDEIVDIEAQEVNDNFPIEKRSKEGMNIPDPEFIDETSEEGLRQIEERRQEIASLPEFPSEWQEGHKEEDTPGFDDNLKLPINATIKEKEVKKLIKKYKRYMKSNFREIRRVENDA